MGRGIWLKQYCVGRTGMETYLPSEYIINGYKERRYIKSEEKFELEEPGLEEKPESEEKSELEEEFEWEKKSEAKSKIDSDFFF